MCIQVFVFESKKSQPKYVKPKPISRQNQKLTQQHNWKKSSSSPCAASVCAYGTGTHHLKVLGRKTMSEHRHVISINSEEVALND